MSTASKQTKCISGLCQRMRPQKTLHKSKIMHLLHLLFFRATEKQTSEMTVLRTPNAWLQQRGARHEYVQKHVQQKLKLTSEVT